MGVLSPRGVKTIALIDWYFWDYQKGKPYSY